MLGTPEPFWPDKVFPILFSRPQKLGTYLSVSRSKTFSGIGEKAHPQKWRESPLLERLARRACRPNESLAAQSKSYSSYSDIQGLAMSRSIGDNVSKPYGVTHKPEIIKIGVDKRDKFILLASDGVWEFLSNQEVLQLIVPFYREKKLEEACDALLKLAYSKWTVDDATVVDDITFILIFIDN